MRQNWIELGHTLSAWQYTSKPAEGKCRIDGETIRLRMRLELVNTTAIPDVLAIESWLAEACGAASTVEQYALAALEEWGGRITLVGCTRTHGKIRVTVGN